MTTIFCNLLHRILPSRRTVVVTTSVVSTTSLLCYLECTTHIPSTKFRTSLLYHTISDQIITPILRTRSWFDPETAHQIAIYVAQHNMAPIYHPSAIEQRCIVGTTLNFNTGTHHSNSGNHSHDNNHNTQIRDLTVPHILGLAAGFDTNATIIHPILQLGFGYTEIGTITLQPQLENVEKPRMFRLLSDSAIKNRYGFNSFGAKVVKENLMAYRNQCRTCDDDDTAKSRENYFIQLMRWLFPTSEYRNGIVGINLGMNTDSGNNIITEYTTLIQQLGTTSDYLVININCPNTPGLREWQTNTNGLHKLLDRKSTRLNSSHSIASRMPSSA